MKITSNFGNVTYLERSRKNEDSTQKEQSEAGYFQQHSTKQDEEEKQPSEAEFDQAMENFSEDSTLAALGFEATVSRNGPGLRVTLKDGRGAVVRQFTGKEFVELRETAEATGRGKLLDKKL